MATPTPLNINELNRKLQNVYPMPQILSKILMIVNDPQANITSLEHVFKYEPSFTLKILTLANSAYYGSPGKVTNIRVAITLLGFNMIKSLAIHASVNEMFHFGTNTPLFSGYDLWKHSVGVGISAKMIARRLRLGNADDLFTLGILHDVGLIIEYQFYREAFLSVLSRLQNEHTEIIEAERAVLGTDHAALTRLLFEKWNIPEALKQVLLHHHRPLEVSEPNRRSACAVALADWLTKKKQFGFHHPIPESMDPEVLALLGVQPLDVEVLMEDFDQEVLEASMLLE